jgi:hypothetical protein
MIGMLLRRLRRPTPAPTVVPPEPDGYFYGGDRTIHANTAVDVVMNDHGVVTEVWFRCMQLPFQVSSPKGRPAYGMSHGLPKLTGVQLSD